MSRDIFLRKRFDEKKTAGKQKKSLFITVL